MAALNPSWNGPGMVSRPASPYSPAGGMLKAASLKNVPPEIGCPVASARRLPSAATPPVLERFPATVAVSGVPEAAVNVPFNVQPASAAVFHPPLRIIPCTPTGDDAKNVSDRRLRWSKLERPRSLFQLLM